MNMMMSMVMWLMRHMILKDIRVMKSHNINAVQDLTLSPAGVVVPDVR